MDINGYNLDSTADPSITANVSEQAGKSNQGIANSYDSGGMSAGRGLLNSQGSDNFNKGMSYGDQATSAAIKSRYNQQYQVGENSLKLEALKGAQADHIRNLQVATTAAGQEVEMNRQKAIIRWKKEQADKKARGAILGTTLGIVGGVVAGVYTAGTGSAAGAAAGYAVGDAAGNAIGGS